MPKRSPTSVKPASPRKQNFLQRAAVHAARICLLIVIVLSIHFQTRRDDREATGEAATISPRAAAKLLPGATTVNPPTSAGAVVLNADGAALGRVLQTSPEADHITGFSGPSNVLIAFDTEDQIAGLEVLSSGDTHEHLEQVRADDDFLKSFNGLTWEEAAGNTSVDAVSGATLTSLAIHESVLQRLGGQPPSLRFPQPPTLEQARKIYPDAASLQQHPQYASRYNVTDKDGKPLGDLLRTSPAADNVVGYGGPTETFIGLDKGQQVTGIALGKSYDNEPYVGYVRDEEYFLTLFNQMKLEEVAAIDPFSGEVEGVSGATMTSLSVAEAMQKAAAAHVEARKQPPVVAAQSTWNQVPWIHLSIHDYGVAVVILLSLLLAFTRLRSSNTLRVCFLVLLVTYLGLTTGNLLSQAMLAGWARSGVPWQKAPGLALLTLAALVAPVFTGRNLYCSHLCPHGALQQLVKRRLPWQWKVPPRLAKWLKMLPAALLVWCVVVAVLTLPFSLVDIEPFDAWLLGIAGWATIGVAIAGLVFALVTPMAYCRYGCPTGAMLKFLTFTSASHEWSRRDWFVLGLTLLACGLSLV